MSAPSRRPRVLTAGPALAARRNADRRAQARDADCRAQARRWAIRGGYGLLGLLPVVLLSWVVLSSPVFDVDRVIVTGADSATLVREVAEVPLGTPLVRVDVGAVRERVATLEAIAAVQVRRDWPGTVRIDVVEREPVAAVPVEEGFRLVAADGTPYATVARRPRGVVPMVVPPPGPSAEDPSTAAALEVLAEVGPPLRARISSVRALSPQRIVLGIASRRLVVWGAPGERAKEKTATAVALLRLPGGTIDVATPGVATVSAVPPTPGA